MFVTLLTSTILLAGSAFGYANPGPCSGVCTNAHDPTLIRRGDGEYFRLSTGNKISIHSAPSISGPWTYRGAALPGGSSIQKAGRDDLWAPEVIQRGQEYFMYYSVSTFGSQDSAIGVATSADLVTWTDRGSTGVESRVGDPFNAIDGHVLKDANGQDFVMSFGSFWGGLHSTPMTNPPHRSLGQGITHLAQETVTTAIEAPFVFQHGGFYYLFFSVGKCCGYDRDRPGAGEEYKIMACRSSRSNGGFTDRNGRDCTQGGGTIVLESHGFVYGPGGQGVYNDPFEGPVLYYHYVDTRVGFGDGQKRFGWNRIDFTSGWPTV